jgi:hypothetical protein
MQSLLEKLNAQPNENIHLDALRYIIENDVNANIKYESVIHFNNLHNSFNEFIKKEGIDETCLVGPTDSTSLIRKKCKKAFKHNQKYHPIYRTYIHAASVDSGASSLEESSLGGHLYHPNGDYSVSYFAGPFRKRTPPEEKNTFTHRLLDPESGFFNDNKGGDSEDLPVSLQEKKKKTSTERVRRYYKRHPKKVRSYLRKTVKDRVARNRDRRKAVARYGKSKMKNHDVHHPNGPANGNWRLAKKDHGPDKKNEAIDKQNNTITCRFCSWTWSLVDGGKYPYTCHKCWNLNEPRILTESRVQENIEKFANYVKSQLRLKTIPSIKVVDRIDGKFGSMGGYNSKSNEIAVVVKGRLLADILRTLAHELIHRKQMEMGLIKNPRIDGKTGSPVENSANALAGIIMRQYGQLNRDIFVSEGVLREGGGYGHLLHPYEDMELSFKDLRTMVERALGTGLDEEGPVVEKTDGQNIMVTVIDGEIRFARSASHIKNSGAQSMTVAELIEKFEGRGDLEKTFGMAGTDLQKAVENMSPETVAQIFGNGRKFMSVEIIHPDTENTIPYGKKMLILHHTVEYDPAGKPIAHHPEDSDLMASELQRSEADKQEEYGIRGQQYIVFSPQDEENKEQLERYLAELDGLRKSLNLKENDTLGDYRKALLMKRIKEVKDENLTPADIKLLINRWTVNKKDNRLTSLSSKGVIEWAKKFESEELPTIEREIMYPLQSLVARVGMDATRRSVDLLSASDPLAAEKIKEKLSTAIEKINSSGVEDEIKKMDTFMRMIDEIGLDRIVPSEGLLFTYKGGLYKFTGAFAPIHRIVGAVKFDRAARTDKSIATEPPSTAHSSGEQDSSSTRIGDKEREAIKQSVLGGKILNPETGNLILTKTALSYDKSHPAYKAAMDALRKEIISEWVLVEGGKAVEGTSKVPNHFSDPTVKHAAKLLGLGGFDRSLVGSTEKPVMGDLDVAMSIEELRNLVGYHGTDNKILFSKLKEHFSDLGLEIKYNPGFQQFSVLTPLVNDSGDQQPAYDVDGKVVGDKGTVQVNFMLGNLPWMKKILTNGSVSKYSSKFRNVLIIDTFAEMIFDSDKRGVKWKYQLSMRNGLEKVYFRIGKDGKREVLEKELVSTEPDDVAKAILGLDAKFEDIDNFEKFNTRLASGESPVRHLLPKIHERFKHSVGGVLKATVPSEVSGIISEQPSTQSPVAIFPGRFQPFHAGHYKTYLAMVEKFGKDNVYVVSSDKQDPIDSPFSFADKQNLITKMFGIPNDRVIQVKNPYSPVEVTANLSPSTPIIFAVGEKDKERLGSNYFKDYDEESTDLGGFETVGHVWVGPPPEIELNGKTISGTRIRHLLGSPEYTDRAKEEVFTKIYGKFDKKLFTSMVKITTAAEEAKAITAAHTVTTPKVGRSKAAKEKADADIKTIRTSGILKQKILNPDTGNEIFVSTALSSEYKDTEVQKTAHAMIQQLLQKNEQILIDNVIVENKKIRKIKQYLYTRDYTEDELDNEVKEYFENKRTKMLFPKLAEDELELKDIIEDAEEIILDRKFLKMLANSEVPQILSTDDRNAVSAILKKIQVDYERDIKGILNAVKNEEELPMPIVIHHEDGVYLLAGNSRLSVLASLNYTMPVKLIRYFPDIETKDEPEDSGRPKMNSKEIRKARRKEFRAVLDTKIINPETGNRIKVKTAMDYNKNHTAHAVAMDLIRSRMSGLSPTAGIPKSPKT